MSDEARVQATPPGIRLLRVADLVDPGARNLVLQMRAGRFHGFVVRRGDLIRGYGDRCPHAGLPLAQQLDDYLTPDGDMIACRWHGALFAIDDGRCLGGPCSGGALTPWPIAVVDEWIVTA